MLVTLKSKLLEIADESDKNLLSLKIKLLIQKDNIITLNQCCGY